MTPPPLNGLWRFVYVGLGLLFVALAGLGVVLPGLPATPFVLLASYFFVRSSPTLHAWLRRSHVFGALLRDWEHHRGVRRSVKVTAYVLIPAVVTASIALGGLPMWANVLIALLAVVGLCVVASLRVVPPDEAGA